MSTATTTRPTLAARRPARVTSETFNQVQALTRRVHAMLSGERARGHVVGVTSSARREGVSVVAANLAVCAAEHYGGKVLLVDANPRHASVASRFGVKQTVGLTDWIAGKVAFQECIARVAQSDAWVLPAGSASPSTRVCGESTSALFDHVRADFELIVVDLPPASEMDERIFSSRLADGFVLVVEAERTRQQVAQRMVRHLEELDAKLLGVVLNRRKNHIPEWLYRRL